MSYNVNNRLATTVVPGSSYTGLYAANGSYNIVINASGSYQGLYHPCGAYNAVSVADTVRSFYAANGSVNVVDTGGAVYVLAIPKNT